MLEADDIVQVDITEEMLDEAELDTEFLKNKIGKNTRAAYSERDLIGSLAHQVVEQLFDFAQLDYISYRKEKFKSGDEYDIRYENDFIDVKGTHGKFNPHYLARQQFLVFSDQLEDKKIEKITHFIFVMIDLDIRTAYVFGEIPLLQFNKLCTPVKLMYDNMCVYGKDLYPFFQYAYRSGPR